MHQAVAALASLQQQDVARAAAAIDRRVRANLNDAAAHRELASVYVKQGRQDEAFAELAIAAWLDPDDPLTFVALGHSLMADHRDGDAVAALERAVTLQPDLRESRYALAQALTRAGRRADATRQLTEFERLRAEATARERRDLEIDALKSTAARQSAESRFRQSADTWKQVIVAQPGVAQNYRELAEVLVRAGALEESLQYFVKTAELDGVAEVHGRLADVLARLGRTGRAAWRGKPTKSFGSKTSGVGLADKSRLRRDLQSNLRLIFLTPQQGQSYKQHPTVAGGPVFGTEWRSMMRGFLRPLLLLAATLFVPAVAYAQVGAIAGVVRDGSGAVMPGVTVEVTSPALIEKVRSTTTDDSGRYQITVLPVGTYKVTFALPGFSQVERDNVQLTSDFTANVNVKLAVGNITETVSVVAESPSVDIQNASVQYVFRGEDIADLPTERDLGGLLNLVPSVTTNQGTCIGGVGAFCNGIAPAFNSHVSARRRWAEPGPHRRGRHDHQPWRRAAGHQPQHRRDKRHLLRHRQRPGNDLHALGSPR